jgi:hypothetical protein
MQRHSRGSAPFVSFVSFVVLVQHGREEKGLKEARSFGTGQRSAKTLSETLESAAVRWPGARDLVLGGG